MLRDKTLIGPTLPAEKLAAQKVGVFPATINIRRAVNWLDGIPQEKTQRSRFARLAPAA